MAQDNYSRLPSRNMGKKKAIDWLLYANFMCRNSNNEYQLVSVFRKGLGIFPISFDPEGWGHSRIKVKKNSYKRTSKKYFQKIMEDEERLEHWTKLINEFKKMDTELLRFIVEKEVPLEQFARQALKEIE